MTGITAGWHPILDTTVLPLAEAGRLGRDALTPRELASLERLGRPRRPSWLASRGVIKLMATRAAPGVPPAFVETQRPGHPRPLCLLPDGRRFPVSVAHDDAFVIGALGGPGTSLGVDIEPVDARAARVIGRYYPQWPVDPESATRLWSALEAAVKCTGLGLHEVLGKARPRLLGADRIELELPVGMTLRVSQKTHQNHIVSCMFSRRA